MADSGRPRGVETPDDLVVALELLRRRAARGSGRVKVGLDELAGSVGMPRSTVHTYLRGTRFPPVDALDSLVIALGADAGEQRAWADAWERAAAWLARQRQEDAVLDYEKLFATHTATHTAAHTATPIADQVDPNRRIRDRPAVVVAKHLHTVIGPQRRKDGLTVRETVRAAADGADRVVALIGPSAHLDPARVTLTELVNCVAGETRLLDEPRIVVVELLLDAPLAKDETRSYAYRLDYSGAYLGEAELAAAGLPGPWLAIDALSGFRRTGPMFTVEVEFQPDDPPCHVRQTYQEHGSEEASTVRPVSVNRWHRAHIAVDHPTAGIHGISWDWPPAPR